MAGYLEPGIYVNYDASGVGSVGSTPYLISVIIGSGPRYLNATVPVVRGAGLSDKLNYTVNGLDDFTILRVGKNSTSKDYYSDVTISSTLDYKNIESLDPDKGLGLKRPAEDYTVSVDSDGKILINWVASVTEDQIIEDPTYATETSGQYESETIYIRRNRKPSDGAIYYVELIYPVNIDNTPEQYKPRLINLLEDVTSMYGGVTMYTDHTGETTTINKLGLGLYLAKLNGAGLVYGLQVPYSTSKACPDQFDYAEAISALQGIQNAYRIVPMDLDNNITHLLINHVNQMSSPEEKCERRLFAGYQDNGQIQTFTDLQRTVGEFAKNICNERIGIVSTYDVTIVLPDGSIISPPERGSAPYICAALAGAEAALPIYQSLTRASIAGFDKLSERVNLLRSQKNMLAEYGLILLEQPSGIGSAITIRHGLTTNMDTIQTRENSITTIKDYTGKLLRSALDKYLGKENITFESLVRMRATVDSVLDSLIQSKIIVAGDVETLQQAPNSPDSVILSVKILPPYPCNYINITVYTN